ncbi:FkbM family methyltransferase [Massilia sp. MS-15]|uniref:FkbM family methyltransferase n=1 Tax=Massilia sp. MS-15 TaxID=2878200 RepID=UPI001CD422E8|nr:FkbM family methyltransferase [Massilia sp. MS-15]MCA1248314.1 FkbM family methyltransferase [Massilia sp. MS-15]
MSFISYSQNGEDVLLWRALGHVKNGFYIDVGANDPEEHSVTKAFYDAGWHGVSIEPLPSFHSAFLEQRPRDINLAIAAGSGNGELTLYDTPQVRGWASPDKAVAEMHRAEGHEVAEITVPVRTLASVCEQYVQGEIHFLKIDVEGFEGEVLRGMDFARWRPWVLVIEATLPNGRDSMHEAWDGLVTGQRYRYAWFDGLNRYYVAEEHADLLDAFRLPPNVFDDYISHHLDKAWAAGEQLTQALRASERHAAELAVAVNTTARQAEQLRKEADHALLRADGAEQERRQADQERREAELARRQAEHDRRQAELGLAAADRGRLEAEKAALNAEHATRQAEEQAEQLRIRTEAELVSLRSQAEAEKAALQAALADSLASSHHLSEWAHGIERDLLATRASTSWRLTAPLRAAGLLVHHLRRQRPSALVRRALNRITGNERLRRLLIPVLLRYPRLGQRVSASLSAIRQAAPDPVAAPQMAAAVAAVTAAVPDEFKGLPVSVRTAMADLRRARASHPARPAG